MRRVISIIICFTSTLHGAFSETSQETVDLIYDMLDVIDQEFRQEEINYTIIAGTLLGAIRHGGVIPWDDDGDIAIQECDIPRLLRLRNRFLARGYELRKSYFSYKLCRTIGKRQNDGVSFPFIDIFTMRLVGDQYVYSSEIARELWKDTFSKGFWGTIINIPFGHLTLRGPTQGEAKKSLTHSYGPCWPHTAQSWNFNHELERFCPTEEKPMTSYLPARHSSFLPH